jgi:hypothetical protein
MAKGLSALFGHLIGVQTVFVAAGILTAPASVAATFALLARPTRQAGG